MSLGSCFGCRLKFGTKRHGVIAAAALKWRTRSGVLASWITAVRRTTMKYYAGLDVSLKKTSICVVDRDGEIALRGSASADAEGVAGGSRPDLCSRRESPTKAANLRSGLTPRRHQSGEMDRSGPVSKCGDAALRRLLFEAAFCVIRQAKRFCSLKSWAVRLAGRPGFRKAAVATACKIAAIREPFGHRHRSGDNIDALRWRFEQVFWAHIDPKFFSQVSPEKRGRGSCREPVITSLHAPSMSREAHLRR